jgi:nitroimidazol reductase NimA-like FMN-containing flavoprotein (pyridoxamine 5'-phosphate oxidase superfamily)
MHVELTPGEREIVRWARVARLATVAEDGRPRVVPVSPVLDGDRLLFATDEESVKVRNIRQNLHVALVFDDYLEDWSRLKAVMVCGTRRVVDHGPEWERIRELLYRKFAQYEPAAPIAPGRSVIVEVDIESVTESGA